MAMCLLVFGLTEVPAWALGPVETAKVQSPGKAGIPEGIQIRIRTLSNRGQRSRPAKWDSEQYNAQDILEMISELRPQVLERYTDGPIDPEYQVPVAPGQPPMTALEFLNASVKAGAPGCIITPRVSLKDYEKGTFFETAQSLFDLPVTPRMRILSVDNWGDFHKAGHSLEEVREMFEKLRAQGWEHIAVNMVGGVHDPLGYPSFAEFGVLKDEGFVPDFEKLDRMKALGYLEKQLLYIDFPGQVVKFKADFGPDERADHLVNVLGGQQKAKGYIFVWPILQGPWDSKDLFTTAEGKYRGASLYEVMKQAILGSSK